MAEFKNIKFKEKGKQNIFIQTNKKTVSSNTYLMLTNNIFNEMRIFAGPSVFTYNDLALQLKILH